MSAHSDPDKSQASTWLLADSPELLRLRVLPAEFARLLGVSKQAVSRWIAEGKVTINPVDGRLDVNTAVRQVLKSSDPGRVRSRVLRAAIADVSALRKAVAEADERVAAVEAELGAQLAEARQRIAFLESYIEDGDCMFDRLLALLVESELALRGTTNSDEWVELIRRIEVAAAEHCDDTDLDALDAAAADALAALTAREAPAPEGGGGE
ncbi:MAG: hypothetical protein AB1482_03860 [Pseudomonadota bacterium]